MDQFVVHRHYLWGEAIVSIYTIQAVAEICAHLENMQQACMIMVEEWMA
jgi:hypothetical protein